ncbi:hypothetical protein F5Y04DRAFT_278996 [Hypomontagnella monticulosa]|nr:hypothetical protein F5Y04DRAFT_278996 [Hypomontagnella monticulosa]
MQLLLILFLSLCGSALSRAIAENILQPISREEFAAPKLHDTKSKSLETRDVLFRSSPINVRQELNLRSGPKLMVRQLGEGFGVPVPPLSQEIERDLDGFGNFLAGKTPEKTAATPYIGKSMPFSVRWETRNHGAIRLMGPEWQNLLVAMYREMYDRRASLLRVWMDISGNDGFDVELMIA